MIHVRGQLRAGQQKCSVHHGSYGPSVGPGPRHHPSLVPDLSALPSSVPPVPTSTHRALAPPTAAFSPAVSSRVPAEKPKILGLNFFRMSLKREGAESTGEREMDVQCWGTGVGRTLLGLFRAG